MSYAMTYASLKQDVRNYLERGSVADTTVFDQIPALIGLAERAIARKLKVQGTINIVLGSLVAGQSVYAKPNRWLRTTSMEFGDGPAQNRTPIFPRSYEYCREYWPDEALTGTPMFYADYNDANWLIVPTPVATVPWQIIYYQQPPLLDDANQTNWLTDLAPDALLYRTLYAAEPFIKNDPRMATWKAMYDEIIADITVQDLEKVVDRSVVRTGD